MAFQVSLCLKKRKMKNNVSQSLDLESLEKEKNIFRLSRFNSYLAFFSVLWLVSHLPPFFFRRKSFSVVKTGVGRKPGFKTSLEESYSIF